MQSGREEVLMTQYVGIDWAYRRAQWCALTPRGVISEEGTLPANEDGLAKLVLRLGRAAAGQVWGDRVQDHRRTQRHPRCLVAGGEPPEPGGPRQLLEGGACAPPHPGAPVAASTHARAVDATLIPAGAVPDGRLTVPGVDPSATVRAVAGCPGWPASVHAVRVRRRPDQSSRCHRPPPRPRRLTWVRPLSSHA